MPAITDVPFSTLLLALITLTALLDWRKRRRRPGRPLWWPPVANAFLGAGVFFVLTVWFFVRWTKSGLWTWIPSTVIDEEGSNWNTCQCIKFLPAFAGAAFVLPQIWRRGQSGHRASRLARAVLLIGLGGALFSRWVMLDDLAPYILQRLFGIWLFTSDLLTAYSGRELAIACLELFAQTALILWLFQCLWERLITRGGSGRGEPRGADRPLKRRCTS
jgi:hypothetical protein